MSNGVNGDVKNMRYVIQLQDVTCLKKKEEKKKRNKLWKIDINY
jgi:hypothetical protein